MKNRYLIMFMLVYCSIIVISCNSSDKTKNASPKTALSSPESAYDSTTAREYGADEYGMKKYVFAFLKRGPNRNLEPEKKQELQKAHLKNIERMAEEGTLVLAGPFCGDGDLRGIYVFNVRSIEEARKLTNTDPAIQAGSLKMELMEWYGTAALMAVNNIHETLSRKNVSE